MCGIAGIVDSEHRGEPTERVARAMADAIAHRGPDSHGVWTDPASGVGLSHRRLAILDLSPEGYQPMTSPSGRFVMTFNGEVFNYRDFGSTLEGLGYRFRGHSDTEAMLAAFEQWGIEDACKRFIGMFVFAVWDRTERTLTLGRDRLGIKPLFYSWSGGAFLFGSELKCLMAHPRFRGELDPDSLALFLRFGYVPGPRTIFKNVFKLTPGCLLRLSDEECRQMPPGFDAEGTRGFPSKQLRPFWSLRDVAAVGQQKLFTGSDDEARERLEALLLDSVKLRMISDVPIGAFLSGGIDSSTVVALMQAHHSRPVRTFSIGFHETAYDEAKHAAAVAKHLGTEHTELYVAEEDLLSVVPDLPRFYDEPFGDSSQIPSLLVSSLARRHVTVALSGDGGDELFGGYNRYTYPPNVWRAARLVPRTVRGAMRGAIRLLSAPTWEKLLRPLASRIDKPGERVQKLATVLPAPSIDALYEWLLAQWLTPASLVPNSTAALSLFENKPRFAHVSDFALRAMFLDQQVYLPDDNLQKVDRASMAVALEARVPLLDHRVVEFAARLPISLKIRGGTTKWLLREVLYRRVPKELIERPKMGFSVPIGSWLRGPLRDWAEALLDEPRIRREGNFRPEPVRDLWSRHLSGEQNFQHQLWNVLMFQAWHERYRQGRS